MIDTQKKEAAKRRAVRKAVNHEQKRKQILDVAGEMFFQQGYANTSIDDIAAQLGVGKPFIYYYFKDKAAIFETLCVDSSDQTYTSFAVLNDKTMTATERLQCGLRNMILNYIDTFVGGALYYKEPGLLGSDAKDCIRDNAVKLHADLMHVLEDGRKSGEFMYEDTKLAALMIGGSIGFMFTWYRRDGALPPTAIADLMVSNLVKIVLAPDHRAIHLAPDAKLAASEG